MKYCQHCGAEANENQDVCLSCGKAIKQTAANDTGGFGWGFLGFCLPLVGLILYLVWKSDRPKNARSAGIGALIGVGVQVISWIVYAVIMASMVMYY